MYKLVAAEKKSGKDMTIQKLQHELQKKRPFESRVQEATLNIVRTSKTTSTSHNDLHINNFHVKKRTKP